MATDPTETPRETTVDVRPQHGGLRLSLRHWPGRDPAFVLLHGLASNARTWDGVARVLSDAGHAVYAVDQRGHGHSDKTHNGYDFATIAEDLALLLDRLELQAPVVAGQSWGGNVVLEFGARYPGRAAGLAFVDGGVLDLQSNPSGGDWESVSSTLRPPTLAGTPRETLKSIIAHHNPEWSDEGVGATLGNFEVFPDGTVRPWLTLERHMRILRALWEQRPGALYSLVQEAVVICAADDSQNSTWTVAKHRMVAAALETLPRSRVHWFHDTAHDIHVHRPEALAAVLLDELRSGIWADRSDEAERR